MTTPEEYPSRPGPDPAVNDPVAGSATEPAFTESALSEGDGSPREDSSPEGAGRSRPRAPWGREALIGVAVLLAVTALGAPLGVIWSAVSPRVLVRMTAGGPFLAESEPEGYAGSDAMFTLIGLGVGIALAVTCWLALRRWRGPVIMLGLMIGSLLGACVAWQLGRRIGLAEYESLKATARVGWQFYRPPSMDSGAFVRLWGLPVIPRGALVVQALAAVFTYTMLAGWSKHPDLRVRGDAGVVGDSADARDRDAVNDDVDGPDDVASRDDVAGTDYGAGIVRKEGQGS